jgi:hypothetical protein
MVELPKQLGRLIERTSKPKKNVRSNTASTGKTIKKVPSSVSSKHPAKKQLKKSTGKRMDLWLMRSTKFQKVNK